MAQDPEIQKRLEPILKRSARVFKGMALKLDHKKEKLNSLRCVKWGCESAALKYLRVGESQDTMNGFFICKIAGWYCPVCGGGYGGSMPPGDK